MLVPMGPTPAPPFHVLSALCGLVFEEFVNMLEADIEAETGPTPSPAGTENERGMEGMETAIDDTGEIGRPGLTEGDAIEDMGENGRTVTPLLLVTLVNCLF